MNSAVTAMIKAFVTIDNLEMTSRIPYQAPVFGKKEWWYYRCSGRSSGGITGVWEEVVVVLQVFGKK